MANFDASSVNSLETPSRPSWRKRAAEVTDPVLKKSLVVAAERWKRLAAEFESGNECLALQRTS